MNHIPDPSFDLLLERTVPVSPELVFKAWTTPDILMQWFCPLPWKTVECVIDLQPGGIFRTVMQGPEGESFAGDACYLEVIENEKIVWTSALGPGYRPKGDFGKESGTDMFCFTAVISMSPTEGGCKYSALVIHSNEADKAKHEAMGFHHGWGAALDQLVALYA